MQLISFCVFDAKTEYAHFIERKTLLILSVKLYVNVLVIYVLTRMGQFVSSLFRMCVCVWRGGGGLGHFTGNKRATGKGEVIVFFF